MSNEYFMMAEDYRCLLEHGKIEQDIAEKEIRIFEFLALCDKDDICRMVDSSAFNDIIRAFTKMAIKNAGIDKESQGRVLNQLRWIFDEKKAKEVLDAVEK